MLDVIEQEMRADRNHVSKLKLEGLFFESLKMKHENHLHTKINPSKLR